MEDEVGAEITYSNFPVSEVLVYAVIRCFLEYEEAHGNFSHSAEIHSTFFSIQEAAEHLSNLELHAVDFERFFILPVLTQDDSWGWPVGEDIVRVR